MRRSSNLRAMMEKLSWRFGQPRYSHLTSGKRLGRLVGLVVLLAWFSSPFVLAAEPPNIIVFVADDLGYGELGCYGQQKIQTPRIDQLAAEGMRFTQFYAGSSSCSPSRASLLTGLTTGRTPIRANGQGPLPEREGTLAKVLKQAGYATGVFGKWGLGNLGTVGEPHNHGFDRFFGFYHQLHAQHPEYIWDDQTKQVLPENKDDQRGQFAPDLVQAQALKFIRENKDRPFFCYYPSSLVHVELAAPDEAIEQYRGKGWPERHMPDPRLSGTDEPLATFAAMVTRMDRHVGEIVDLVEELGLSENTLIIFTSDNGGQGGQWAWIADFFEGNGPLRGYKAQFYEGGIRVPCIAWWPGQISEGVVSEQLGAFWDILPTLAELVGAETSSDLDGVSLVPTLLGRERQQERDWLYWEHPRGKGLIQAGRLGDWKAVRHNPNASFKLYNLRDDLGETTDLADEHPEILQKIQARFAESRTEPQR